MWIRIKKLILILQVITIQFHILIKYFKILFFCKLIFPYSVSISNNPIDNISEALNEDQMREKIDQVINVHIL